VILYYGSEISPEHFTISVGPLPPWHDVSSECRWSRQLPDMELIWMADVNIMALIPCYFVGSLSPQHSVSSGCGWIWKVAENILVLIPC